VIVAYNALSVRPGVLDGGATFTLNVLRHLPRHFPQDILIVYARAGENRIVPAPNLEIVYVAAARGPVARIAFELFGLSRDLRRRRVDVFVSPNESVPPSAPGRVVVVAQNLVYHCAPTRSGFVGATVIDRIKTVAQFAYWRYRMRRVYRRASTVIAVSEETRRVLEARAGLRRDRTAVVHEGSDSFLLPDSPAVACRARRLLVVSTLAPYKGLEETIEVFAALRRTHPDVELEIVGGDWRGFGAVVREQISVHGLADVVRIRGSVEPAELAELYRGSLMLLLLSRCESFGLPLMEAMRFGLPAAVADCSSLPEVAGGAAMLLDPDDIEKAAARVGALIDDDAARAELSARGELRARELTWENTARGVAEAVRVSRDAG
jgi:glycosyltransferase involved in cell wall biosynthesis